MALIKIEPYIIDTTGDFTFNNVTATGNLSSLNANLGNLATANFFIGSGANLTNLPAGNVSGQVANALVSGTVYTNAQPNITSVGTLTSLTVTGNVTGGNLTTSGNVNAPIIVNGGTGIYLSAGPAGYINFFTTGGDKATITDTGNIAASNLIANSTVFATTANISGNVNAGNANLGNLVTANFFTGNGSLLTGISVSAGNTIVNGNSNVVVSANGNVTTSVAGNANILVVTGTGVNVAGTLNVSGNTTVANLSTTGSGGNISNVNVVSANTFTASGNITAGTLNVTGNANAGNIGATTGVFTAVTGSLTTAAQPNITSVGTLTGITSTGTANLTGASNVALGPVANVHITGGSNGQYLQTDGSGILTWATVASGSPSNISNGNSNVNIPSANGNINLTAVGNTTLIVTGTGVNVAGTLNVSGNATLGNIITSGSGGNISNANVISANTITSLGNLNGVELNLSGNGVFGGNLTVNGTITYINSTTLSISDPIINLQTGPNGAVPVANTGKDVGTALNYYDTTAKIAWMGWDVSNAEIAFGSNVGISSEVVTFTSLANIRSGNASLGNSAVANYFTGNFYGTANSATTAGTVTTNAQPNITSTGSLTGLTVSNATGVVDFTTTANVTLGAVANLHISGGTNGYVLQTDGSGTLSWVAQAGGGTVSNISNGNSNVSIPGANGNINLTAVGNTTLIVTGTGANITGTANITGNLSANNITAGSGSGGNITGGNVISANTFIALASANFVAAANVNLGAVGNVKITGGSSSQYLQTDGTGNLSWSTVASGASSNISNGNSNVNIPSANGNVNISAVGNANVLVVTGTGANITGTANVTGNLSANNITAGSGSGGNITGGNVISANTFTASGNITAGNANLGNAVTANFFIGSGNNLSNIQGANVSGQVGNALVSGTVYTNAQPNITSVGTLTSLAVTGNTTSGNLIGPLANGNSNVNIPSSNGNINLTAVGNTTLIITGTGANITGTANITGNLSAGNANTGNLLTTNNLSVTTFVTSNLIPNANVTYDLGNTTNRWKDLWLSNSTLYFDTNATVSAGTLTNGNSTVSIPTANGNINLTAVSNTTMVITGTGANITGTANISGNLSANNITAGSGSGGNITGGNLVSANYFTGTLTTSAQPNITSVGSLTGLTVSNATGVVDFTTTANVTLGGVGNLHIAGGTSGYVLQTDGAGILSWVAQSGGGGSTSNISNGNSNVSIAAANGNITMSAVGNANIVVVTGTGVNVAGTLNVTGQSNLGAVGNVKITGGTANYILNTDGAGNLSWVAPPAGANVTVDNFTGNGVQTIFTLSTTPTSINQTSVNYNGATVLRTDYTLANADITFSSAPANGSYIEVTTINLTTSGGGGGTSAAAAVGYSLIFGG
jgi:hypothetical protein